MTLFFLLMSISAQEVQIGVLGLFHPKEIHVSAQPGHPLECHGENDQPMPGRYWNLMLVSNQLLVTAQNQIRTQLTFHCDGGHGSDTEFHIAIPGKISRRYRGWLDIQPFGVELLVLVSMELETAVASVVAAESSPTAPLEALKAQAVAARSFLTAGDKRHLKFNFCDTTHCQFLREPPRENSLAWQATALTRGLVLVHHGGIVPALYSASCGGRTHSLQELGLPTRGYPYYSVVCSYCLRYPKKWASRLSLADAQSLDPTERSRLALSRRLGWRVIPSNSYVAYGNNEDSVFVEGTGAGHGLGLCQRGGAAMARNGSKFNEILEYYYPNTSLKQI